MATQGIIKVSTQELKNAASKFETSANTTDTIKQKMIGIIDDLSKDWTGKASSTYSKQFKALDGEIKRMIDRIKEHNKDLLEMANVYSKAEDDNEALGASLSTNFIK